ncbi:hypothetical protein H257_10905 [Aphanomyces astaci]|uniref:HAT C-terminal dimerisation domain-containing protein n=1 Tax=Aphanomyces astaci TaxID=112090 RepID=W4G6E8_APHAT|nr:hypothetical protein H257_10905 [Aphanomyces astaci]ETV74866.1 hypothetical protein H257_10905 [Aphanomyces astaci]|eukprot:XP_009835953.1 hypothetical protein H257_10905 [Aphanomyces astaci]
MSHLISCHPDYASLYEGFRPNAADGCAFPLYVSPAYVSLHGWMDLIVSKHMSLSTLSNPRPRSNLPKRFGLVFDGWSSDGASFYCVLATFCKNGELHTPIPAFAPMLDEGDLSAAQHVGFLAATLELYGRTINPVTFLVGDNLLHRLNLVVHQFLDNHESILDSIHAMMLRCRTAALEVIQGFTIILQLHDLAMNEARALQGTLVERFSGMASYLSPHATLECERAALAPFEVVRPSPSPSCLAMKDLQAKRAKLNERIVMEYENLRCVLPTSNIIECLFSKAKLVYTSLRQRLAPESLEILMFLGANRAYWNTLTVEQVRKKQ